MQRIESEARRQTVLNLEEEIAGLAAHITRQGDHLSRQSLSSLRGQRFSSLFLPLPLRLLLLSGCFPMAGIARLAPDR